MGIKYSLITFTVIFFAACNNTPKEPEAQEVKSTAAVDNYTKPAWKEVMEKMITVAADAVNDNFKIATGKK